MRRPNPNLVDCTVTVPWQSQFFELRLECQAECIVDNNYGEDADGRRGITAHFNGDVFVLKVFDAETDEDISADFDLDKLAEQHYDDIITAGWEQAPDEDPSFLV